MKQLKEVKNRLAMMMNATMIQSSIFQSLSNLKKYWNLGRNINIKTLKPNPKRVFTSKKCNRGILVNSWKLRKSFM